MSEQKPNQPMIVDLMGALKRSLDQHPNAKPGPDEAPKVCKCDESYHGKGNHGFDCDNPPVDKAVEVDFEAADREAKCWSGDPWAKRNLGLSYLALRAEVERLEAEILKRDEEAGYQEVLESDLRAELAQAREEIAKLREILTTADDMKAKFSRESQLERQLAAEKAARARDAEVFRGQLGYAVQQGCEATLQDGTLPENVLAKSLKQYWDNEKAARERAEAVILNTAKLWTENRHYNIVADEVLAAARAILASRAKGESNG